MGGLAPAGQQLLPITETGAIWRALMPATVSPPPPPLLLPPGDLFPDWMEEAHNAVQGAIGPLGCWILPGGTLGGAFMPGLGGRSLTGTSILPEYVNIDLANDAVADAPHRLALPQRRIVGPLAVVGAPGHANFGHWLLDILPRLWVLGATYGTAADRLAIAVPSDMADFAAGLFAIMGVPPERLVLYDPLRETLRADLLVLPSMAHAGGPLHPAVGPFYDALLSRFRLAAPPGEILPEHIYISRTRWSGYTARRLVNAAEIEALAVARGFTVLHPQEHPWPEQARRIAAARVIVGEHGSAMKNLVFAPARTVVINMNFLNTSQSSIAGLRDHRLGYLAADPLPDVPGGREYRIDPAKLARCLDAALAA